MKFLNLETGYSFDGLWTNEQSKGYIFWFPNEQSTNIIYSNQICILSENNDPLTLSLNDNDIFGFPKPDITPEVISEKDDSFIEKHCEFTHTIDKETWGEKINDTYYAHAFNILCQSRDEGEYICKISIGDYGYIRVGADFYGENESLYVNLANFGVEIPETIQKAIYDSNVHEDFKDNILINRKFKELLSNYWDIIANKGSYKSLVNSLKWFEWGDKLEIKEIWRHLIADKSFFNDKEVMSIFESKLNDSFENYVKTAYISLYCSLYDELQTANAVFYDYNDYCNKYDSIAINAIVKLTKSTDDHPAGFYRVIDKKVLQYISNTAYDSEFNPVLIDAVLKYSINDIKLKLSLLAQFFGSFFLPIHMSILHAAAETKVFTNTIKTVLGSVMKRNDCFGSFEYVESNIKDDSIYKMTNVRAQVTDATTFAIKWKDPKYDEKGNAVEDYNTWFGVDEFTSKGKVDESNIKTFAVQYYTGPGLILPIEMIIPNQYEKDMIHHTIADVMYNDTVERLDFYDKFLSYIDFSLNNNFVSIPKGRYDIYLRINKDDAYAYIMEHGKQPVANTDDVISNDTWVLYGLTDKNGNVNPKMTFSNGWFVATDIDLDSNASFKFVSGNKSYGGKFDSCNESIKLIKNVINNKFKINFNYLIKEAADYTIRFTFFTTTGKTITRTLKFTVEDADNLCINVYKVQAKDDTTGLTYDDFNDTDSCGYLFKTQPEQKNDKLDKLELKDYTYTQVLPYMLPTNPLYESYKGIKLSRLVIFDIQNKNNKAYKYGEYEQMVIRGLMDNDFLEFDRFDDAGNITYMVFVSKYFYADVPQEILDKKYNIIRNELIFLPQFHKLTLMTGLNADNYTVSQYEAVCCAAEINTLYGVKPFRYGHMIKSSEWTFINATDNSMIYHPSTSRAPFIAAEKTYINPGYYDISFKYSLTNGIADECKLDSGFRIKVI